MKVFTIIHNNDNIKLNEWRPGSSPGRARSPCTKAQFWLWPEALCCMFCPLSPLPLSCLQLSCQIKAICFQKIFKKKETQNDHKEAKNDHKQIQNDYKETERDTKCTKRQNDTKTHKNNCTETQNYYKETERDTKLLQRDMCWLFSAPASLICSW